MSATVYLDRDNDITLRLTQDGGGVSENVITKVSLWIPGTAFSGGGPQVVDSNSSYITLTDNATSATLSLGSLAIRQGTHSCYLTVYDAVNLNGLAWDRISLRVRDWPATV